MRMDKQMVVHTMEYYWAIKKKEYFSDTHSMDESQNHVELKKLDIKKHIIWLCLYEVLEKTKLIYGGKNQNRDYLWVVKTDRKET